MGFQHTKVLKVSIEKITPKRAQEWLDNNENNRKLRPSVVASYRDDMEKGEWVQTHQGIAVTLNGQLLDGQHRLSALVQAGVTLEMPVAYYPPNTSPLNIPLDLQARRTLADILKRDRKQLEVLKFVLREVIGDRSGHRMESAVMEFLDHNARIIERFFEELPVSYSERLSSTPVRAAVFVAYLANKNWISEYELLIKGDLDLMSSSTRHLWKTLTKPGARASNTEFRYRGFACTLIIALSSAEVLSRPFGEKALEKAWEFAAATMAYYMDYPAEDISQVV